MPHLPLTREHAPPCSACTIHSSFCPLPSGAAGVLEKLKTSATYGRKDIVFEESESCHSVFIICKGSIKLTTASSEGRVLLLRFAGPGEILGLSAAVGGTPHEYSAVAAEPSVLAVIPRGTFLRFAAAEPQVCWQLTAALSEQYRVAQRETKFLAFGGTSTARLAHLLLEWQVKRGEVASEGIHVPPHVTHTELAQSIGSTRETVTRILADLRNRGVVERRPDSIVVRSAEELARLDTY